jgi:glycosyltransferase involved in cell wall biosynthesis
MEIRKIIFILHMPPPIHGASIVGRYIQKSEFINSRFDCDFINLSTTSSIKDIESWDFKKFITVLKLYARVFTKVARKRYSFCYLTINSHGPAFYKELIIVLILKLFGCNIVYHYHNKGIEKNQENWLNNLLYSFQFKNSRAILLSKLLYSDLSRYLPDEKVYFCPNGIPALVNFEPDVLALKRNSKIVPELLFLSNMMKEKGVYVLLEACKILVKRKIRFIAHLVGSWGDIKEKDLYSFLEKFDLQENVKYAGEKYGDEKSSFFERADIFIHPTLNDCFPLVILEAMQYGLPVISTDEGAIPEIVKNDYNGFLVPKNDPEALAIKITELINDPYLRIKMGNCGRRRFEEQYTVENFEENFVSVLNKISLVFDQKNGKSPYL